jgi:hypothetical protein
MNTIEENRQKQRKNQRRYEERNRETVLELRRIAFLNEVQNGYLLLDV